MHLDQYFVCQDILKNKWFSYCWIGSFSWRPPLLGGWVAHQKQCLLGLWLCPKARKCLAVSTFWDLNFPPKPCSNCGYRHAGKLPGNESVKVNWFGNMGFVKNCSPQNSKTILPDKCIYTVFHNCWNKAAASKTFIDDLIHFSLSRLS